VRVFECKTRARNESDFGKNSFPSGIECIIDRSGYFLIDLSKSISVRLRSGLNGSYGCAISGLRPLALQALG